MYRFLLNELTPAIQDNLSYLELFRVGTTPYVAKIEKKDYETTLKDAQKFYIGEEEYEEAERCQRLLEQHRVNLIIDSTGDKKE